jgi:hypothetical protein
MLKKGDIILIGIIILGALCWFVASNVFMSGQDTRVAVIKQNDITIKTIDLDKLQSDQRVNISGAYHEVILAEKGRIRFLEADCPDKVCVKTGWLTKKGDVAVCLPNKVIIKIEGENTKIDGVTY